MSNLDGLEFKDTITKQDLVDYAITKKVEEISNAKSKLDKKCYSSVWIFNRWYFVDNKQTQTNWIVVVIK